jgi:hypothetical protein
MLLHDAAQIRRGHDALAVAISCARRDFRPTAFVTRMLGLHVILVTDISGV